MAKVIAGEVLTLNTKAGPVTVKVEDGSKSEYILAKVQSSSSEEYKVGNIYEFERSKISGSENS